MKKYIYIFLIFMYNLLSSQDKSVGNYSLIKGVETNNNLYSGLVNVSIPLYKLPLGNGMELVSGISYESNGFRPHLEPDLVGLNWNTNLVGKITRETNRPLTRRYSLYYNDVTGSEQDCFKPNPSNFTKKILLESPISTSDSYFTWMTDKYYFDFLGYKGYFVVDHDGKTIVYCENANLKVDISNLGCQPLFGEIFSSEITLKDDRGNTFIFGGTSNELEINYHQFSFENIETFTNKQSISQTTTAKRNVRTNYIVGWALKKAILNNGRILNAYYKNSNKSILNSFINEGKNVTNPFNISFPSTLTLLSNNLYMGRTTSDVFTGSTRYSQDGDFVSTDLNNNTIYSKLSMLDSITVSDIGKIVFEYENTSNPLELSKAYLKKVKVSNINNKEINEVSLSYENLGNSNKRTFLKKITNENNEEYIFEYYKTDLFPPYSSWLKNEMGFWDGRMTRTDPENTDLEIFKTGLLKRILLPTRGYKEFFYEPHKYSMVYKDTNVVVDETEKKYYGARVYKEVDNDGINTYTKNYKYVDAANKSTGILDQGVYARPEPVALMNNYGVITISAADTFSTENLSANMYSSDFVHYEQVQEIDGKGIKRYFFTNRKTNSDSLASQYFKNPNFNGVSNLTYTYPKLMSKENERGKLKKLELLDSNGNLKIITEYKYSNFLNAVNPLNEPSNSCLTCKISDNNYYVIAEGLPSADGRRMYIPVLPYLPISTTTTEYFGNKSIVNYKRTIYNDKYLNWHPFPIEEMISSTDGAEINKKSYYPGDLLRLNTNCIVNNCNDSDLVGARFATYKNMLNDNIVVPIITIEKNSKGKNNLAEKIYSKDLSTSNIWKVSKDRASLLNADFSALGNVQIEDVNYYQLYDNKGNLLQSAQKDGVPTTTIWGYHQTLPIAQLVGINYTQLMQIFGLSSASDAYLNLDIVQKSNLDKDFSSEQTLLNALELFKQTPALKDYLIKTYTYNPLVGMTTNISSDGLRENYIYDTKNRLEKITNKSGEIIKEFNYNYALPYTYPIIYYNREKSKVFTRKNCGDNYAGGTYTYTVPAEIYSSNISQADADQKALDDINSNGQNAANQNAVCIASMCPFTPIGGLTSQSVIYTQNDVVYFRAYIRNYSISPGYWNTARTIGLITGDCKPTITAREFTFDEPPGGAFGDTPANRTWQVRVDAIGNVSAKLLSGSVGSNSGNPWNFTFQFDKND